MRKKSQNEEKTKAYGKFPNKGAGRGGKTLGGSPIREDTSRG